MLLSCLELLSWYQLGQLCIVIVKKVLGRKQAVMVIFQGNDVIGTVSIFVCTFNYCFHSCRTFDERLHRGWAEWPKNGFLTMEVMLVRCYTHTRMCMCPQTLVTRGPDSRAKGIVVIRCATV